jgi:hypothetical protein
VSSKPDLRSLPSIRPLARAAALMAPAEVRKWYRRIRQAAFPTLKASNDDGCYLRTPSALGAGSQSIGFPLREIQG